MSGRDRITAAACGHQPARLWELYQGWMAAPNAVYQVWVRVTDGYRVEVRYTRAGSVRTARLRSPAGMWRILHGRDRDKATRVIAWLDNPEEYLKPPAPMWRVYRDGKPVSEPLATEGDCIAWLHKNVPYSAHHATKYEGYSIHNEVVS